MMEEEEFTTPKVKKKERTPGTEELVLRLRALLDQANARLELEAGSDYEGDDTAGREKKPRRKVKVPPKAKKVTVSDSEEDVSSEDDGRGRYSTNRFGEEDFLENWDVKFRKNERRRVLHPIRKLAQVKEISALSLDAFMIDYELHLNDGGTTNWWYAFEPQVLKSLSFFLRTDVISLSRWPPQLLRERVLAKRAAMPTEEWNRKLSMFEMTPGMSMPALLKLLAAADAVWRLRSDQIKSVQALETFARSFTKKIPRLCDVFLNVDLDANFDFMADLVIERWTEFERVIGTAAITEKPVDPRLLPGANAVIEIQKKGKFACFKCGDIGHLARDCKSKKMLPTYNATKTAASKKRHASDIANGAPATKK